MITYGDGNLFLSSNEQMIDIKYDGVIIITERPNGVIIDGNRRKLSIYMENGKFLPELLFKYKGILKIASVRGFEDGQSYIISTTVLGLDFWNTDTRTWEDDTSLWGAKGDNYRVGFPQRYRPDQFDNIIKSKSSNSNKTNNVSGAY